MQGVRDTFVNRRQVAVEKNIFPRRAREQNIFVVANGDELDRKIFPDARRNHFVNRLRAAFADSDDFYIELLHY